MTEGKLIILLKNPEAGLVKTRLARQIGDKAALEVYMKLIDRIRREADPLSQDKAVYYSRFIDRNDEWKNSQYTKHLQSGADVGERMFNAISEVLGEGYGKAVLIGSDISDLKTEILEEAFQLLDKHDVVIGPARDGGYYLIGMKKPHEGLFDLKYWSTPNVFSETVKRIMALKLSYAQTELLNDIDEVDDLRGSGLYDFS